MVTKRVHYYFTADDDNDFKYLWLNGCNVDTMREYFGVSEGAVYNKRIALGLPTYAEIQVKLSKQVVEKLENARKNRQNGSYMKLFTENGGRDLNET